MKESEICELLRGLRAELEGLRASDSTDLTERRMQALFEAESMLERCDPILSVCDPDRRTFTVHGFDRSEASRDHLDKCRAQITRASQATLVAPKADHV